LIFSQFVDLKSKPWRLLLQLQEIIDIILAPKITEGMLAHFATQYAEFSENFSALYPDVSIRPKMHFLYTIQRLLGRAVHRKISLFSTMKG
jgi:hypothetical protein